MDGFREDGDDKESGIEFVAAFIGRLNGACFRYVSDLLWVSSGLGETIFYKKASYRLNIWIHLTPLTLKVRSKFNNGFSYAIFTMLFA